MSLSVIVIGAIMIVAAALWLYFGGGSNEEVSSSQPSSFRCKACGKMFSTFVDAHEHASADHDLAGHKIDESIETQ